MTIYQRLYHISKLARFIYDLRTKREHYFFTVDKFCEEKYILGIKQLFKYNMEKNFLLNKKFVIPNGCAAIDEFVQIDNDTVLPPHNCTKPIILLKYQDEAVGIVEHVSEMIKIYVSTDQGTAYIESSDNSGAIGYDDGSRECDNQSRIKTLSVDTSDYKELSEFLTNVRNFQNS